MAIDHIVGSSTATFSYTEEGNVYTKKWTTQAG